MVREFADLETLSAAAAEKFCRITQDAIAARGRCTVVLAGGSTPRRPYELLATPMYRTKVQWDRLEFFWGDERMVPHDHPDSNFRMANETLLSRIPVSEHNIHRIQTERGAPQTVAQDYEEEIAQVFHLPLGGQPPAFDVILLGMGADGHTASLFPYSDALDETSRWVVPNHGPMPDIERVTMTPRVINTARHVIFLVAGADKAQTLAQVLEGTRDPQRFPAQLICPVLGELAWFVDFAAAAELRRAKESGGLHA